MNRNAGLSYLLVLTLIGLAACSSAPSNNSAKSAPAPDKIQGKAQIAENETMAIDAALNAGGPSVYLIDGMNRYRLYFNKPFPVEAGKEYIAEGVNAQKQIDQIGDPDQGKNGYPLDSSCDRVVKMAWPSTDFNLTDSEASTLRARVRRYPARPVFLVTQLTPVASKASAGAPEDNDSPEISVPADKQRALLVQGPSTLTAPLWDPTGGSVTCKVVISDGKVSELDSGSELCEFVPWSQFRYQPTLKGGHPVKVKTEIAVRFEPRK